MSKPETGIVDKIMLWLKAGGGWWFKSHGGPFQVAGLPDIIGCYEGRFVAIEVKIPGKKPSKLQELVMGAINEAGGSTGAATNVEEALAIRDWRK